MNTPNDTYHKLNRAALWLLVGEFSGVALLLTLMLLMIIGNLISPYGFDVGYRTGEAIALLIAFSYGLAYLANLVIGIIGVVLYVREGREGYPGTGHLVNWILAATTLWVALFLIAIITINGF
jgi:hypothetical protein